jgi:ABC-type antimicrobial peptide transport system permease subunit
MKQLFSILIGLSIFVVYVGITRRREGFEVGKTPTDFLKELKSAVEAKNGSLNLSVYKKDYQNIINELDRSTDLGMLEMITTKNINTPINQMYFNHASEFKKNLSEFKTVLNSMS